MTMLMKVLFESYIIFGEKNGFLLQYPYKYYFHKFSVTAFSSIKFQLLFCMTSKQENNPKKSQKAIIEIL